MLQEGLVQVNAPPKIQQKEKIGRLKHYNDKKQKYFTPNHLFS